LLGTNGSAFFPIGLWYEGANRDAGHVGAAPEDPRDAEEYYEEPNVQHLVMLMT
jgi:hypothetical protein